MKEKRNTRRGFISLLGMLLLKPFSPQAFGRGDKGKTTMKTILHHADTRGAANHGWLKSHHSFSFASWYNPERMGFGLLRVINDDQVAPSMGFGTHPHKDMEIISIPLKGALRHKDSEGNETVIKNGEVQLMSAGTGVYHSEYNDSDKEDVNFLQIWVLPEKRGIKPRYDQKSFSLEERKNKFQTVVSPISAPEEGVKINQQSYFSLIDLDQDKSAEYQLKNSKHGVYVFLLDGKLEAANEILAKRDGLGVMGTDKLELKAKEKAQVLVMEVPLA